MELNVFYCWGIVLGLLCCQDEKKKRRCPSTMDNEETEAPNERKHWSHHPALMLAATCPLIRGGCMSSVFHRHHHLNHPYAHTLATWRLWSLKCCRWRNWFDKNAPWTPSSKNLGCSQAGNTLGPWEETVSLRSYYYT